MSILKNLIRPFFSDKKVNYNSKYHWILDPGHGGKIDGVYQTEGKRSPNWETMPQYFEGVGNREIAKLTSNILDKHGISHTILTETFGNPDKDIPLWARAKKANQIAELCDKPCILLSIHSNGHSSESANGWEVWTSKGETLSDYIADIFAEEAQEEFKDHEMRWKVEGGETGKGLDKDANFYILRKTTMPAVLVENFFHTNKLECEHILNNPLGKQRLAQYQANAILKVEKDSYIAKHYKK